MEILILIAILVVGGSALYVAVTFNRRTSQSLAPLMRAMASNNKVLTAYQDTTVTAIGAIRLELDQVKQSIEEIDVAVRRDPFHGDLEKINSQLGQLNGWLARQREMISAIKKDIEEQEMKKGGSDEKELEYAMLATEAYVARQGWGQRPQLFSLARRSSVVAADHELAGQLQDAAPDALIPVLQDEDELPAGQPLDALAKIHWPGEVLGCALVTEFVILPPEAEKYASNDPDTAERWAAAQSTAHEARLAVCVSRDGGYICGLRMKGDDDVQVSPDLADDLVAALLATF